MFLLGLSGCGYKADPFYKEDTVKNDDNIEFKIKNPDIKEISNTECDKEEQ